MRIALFVAKRHKRGRSWGFALLYRSPDSLGLVSLNGIVVAPRPKPALAGNGRTPQVKGVGEPGAGEPHARFDGGELEKEPLRQPIMAALGKPRDLSPALPTAATSPAPYPTNLL